LKEAARLSRTSGQEASQNNVDVVAYFSAAESEVGTNLKNEDKSTDPEDERYSTATLDGFSLTDDGKLILEVTVLSVAGTY